MLQFQSLLDDTRIQGDGRSKLTTRIERQDLFCADWYNHQLGENRLPAAACKRHFDDFGWHMGLSPHPIFDTRFYLAQFPATNWTDINPLAHFLSRGIREGRAPHPLIDCAYIAQQAGGGADGSPALIRYFNGAWRDGISPSPWFDVAYVNKKNRLAPDTEPLMQYLLSSAKLQFRTHPGFDARLVERQLAARGITVSDPLSFYLTSELRHELRRQRHWLGRLTSGPGRRPALRRAERRVPAAPPLAPDPNHCEGPPRRAAGAAARAEGGRRPIVFLIHPEFRFAGSTILASVQTASILSRHLSTRMVMVTSNPDISDSLVVLSKASLRCSTQAQIRALKKNGNILLGSFVDDQIKAETAQSLDGLIAYSMGESTELKRICPDKPVFRLPPNIDERLPAPAPPKGLKIGYFGELANTISNRRIARHVDFHHVDTSRSDSGWMQRLPHYNCHYIVRKFKDSDGHKPLTKCFLAAHYLAPVIVEAHNDEALHHLGADYPYQAASSDTEGILRAIALVRSTYGTDIWRDAVERMAAMRAGSRHEELLSQFGKIIRTFC